jgi:ATP-binding cassette subfamily B protein
LSICTSHIEETSNFIKIIQAFSGQNQEIANFNAKIIKNLDSAISKIKIRSFLISLVIIFAFLTIILILLLGSIDVVSGKMTKGDLSSFLFYAIILASSAIGVSRIFSQLNTASVACNRLFEILDFKSAINEPKNPVKLSKNSKINIDFENVSFSYPKNPDKLLLKNFTFKINNGQRIAIIGKSGIGKSSIFEILLRFYNINSGKIMINNQDITKISLSDLRSIFSYISQDYAIFSGTIWDNIAYNNNIDKKDVAKILENDLFSFIKKLPDGLDHMVGQKGNMMSGGEKQRIAILRAILKDAKILLIDEFTSALDDKNQKLAEELLEIFAKDKIIINITHKKIDETKYDKIIKL